MKNNTYWMQFCVTGMENVQVETFIVVIVKKIE